MTQSESSPIYFIRASWRAFPLCLLFAAGLTPSANAQTDSATYRMTFEGDWTAADITDNALPGGAHFTSIVGAPHASGVTLWAPGTRSSPGIEDVAELGSTAALAGEVGANDGAGPFISAGSSIVGPTATVSTTFTTSSARPEVSIISMIAPSPDWFVGVSKESLRDGNGWKNEVSFNLYAWDAGTEDGGGWSLSNPATSPRGVIAYIGDSGKFNGRKLATLTFERTDRDEPVPPQPPDVTGGGTVLSSDATLSALTGSGSGDGVDTGAPLALDANFSAATESYTSTVSHATTHVAITPTVNHENATVKIGLRGKTPDAVNSGDPGPAIALEAGENVIEVEVTAEDGNTTKTYTLTITREAPPRPLDPAAAREHLFPLFADGDDFRSYLLLTNVSRPGSRCTLSLRGAGLEAARFEEHAALSEMASGFEIDLGATGADTLLSTTGELDFAVGYAKLACADPAVARVLLSAESVGMPLAMTSMTSAEAVNTFQFPVLPRLGRLGLVLSNDNAMDAACAIEVDNTDDMTTVNGTIAGGGNIAVPAESTAFRFLDELLMTGENDATARTAEVTCNRAVAALGIQLGGGVFTALSAIDTTDEYALNPNDESRYFYILPLVLDGAGFRSNLLATGLSAAANRCAMHFHGPGVSTARFADAAGVIRDGFARAELVFTAPGEQISMLSFGRHSPAYGHAALDCEAPVHLRNVLSLNTTESAAETTENASAQYLAGIAAISPARPARKVRFPYVSRLGNLQLILSNNTEAETSCETLLAANGQQTPISANEPIRIAGKSTEARYLSGLFELPENFTFGTVNLSCDREVAATSLLHTGPAFTEIPPLIPRVNP